jgi:hypothetical protein
MPQKTVVQKHNPPFSEQTLVSYLLEGTPNVRGAVSFRRLCRNNAPSLPEHSRNRE